MRLEEEQIGTIESETVTSEEETYTSKEESVRESMHETKVQETTEGRGSAQDPLEKLKKILSEIELPKTDYGIGRKIPEELNKRGLRIEPITTMRGFKIFLVEIDNKRYAVWFRRTPVSRNALEMAEKVLRNYEIDGKILVKIARKADYVRTEGWIKVVK